MDRVPEPDPVGVRVGRRVQVCVGVVEELAELRVDALKLAEAVPVLELDTVFVPVPEAVVVFEAFIEVVYDGLPVEVFDPGGLPVLVRLWVELRVVVVDPVIV
jgi:hypothetical protein